PLADVHQLGLHVRPLPQRDFEGVGLLGRAVVLGDQPRLLGDKTPPPIAHAEDGHAVEDGEEKAEPDGQSRQRKSGAAPPSRFDRREVDSDHFDCSLSPDRRRPSPTATARAGAIAAASSAYADATSIRSKGRASSTGIPQLDARYSFRPGSCAQPPANTILPMRSDSAVEAKYSNVRWSSSDSSLEIASSGGTSVSHFTPTSLPSLPFSACCNEMLRRWAIAC